MSTASLQDSYAGVYDNSLGFGRRPALILIDFVEAYFNEASPLYAGAGVWDVLAAAVEVREAARSAGLLIIYTNVSYAPSLIDGGRFAQKVAPLAGFARGHPMGMWPRGFAPLDSELVISKQYPSAFFGTSLSSTLTANGKDSLIISGLTTSGCVRATAVDCCSHGFIPLVVKEAVGDRHQAPHDANLFDIQAKYGEVVDKASTLHYLNDV